MNLNEIKSHYALFPFTGCDITKCSIVKYVYESYESYHCNGLLWDIVKTLTFQNGVHCFSLKIGLEFFVTKIFLK